MIHDPGGVAVIADIHACIEDLLKSLKATGWPTQRTLLFLGDYVDRGKNPVEVLFLVMLLKLRYPQRVFLLRGNHEDYNMNDLYGLKTEMERFFGIKSKFALHTLNDLFDHLPIAAIISDQVFCCHGGISQWIRSREDISNFKRPTRWTRAHPITHRSKLIFTDLLWADPADDDNEVSQYVPSTRCISYFFNKKALRTILRRLKCRALIRAHYPYKEGYTPKLNGYCHSLHSCKLPIFTEYMAAVMLLDLNKYSNLLEMKIVRFGGGETDISLIALEIHTFYSEIRTLYPMDDRIRSSTCAQCEKWKVGIPEWELQCNRTWSHSELHQEIVRKRHFQFARPIFEMVHKHSSQGSEPHDDELFEAARLYPKFFELMISHTLMTDPSDESFQDAPSSECDFVFRLPRHKWRWPKIKLKQLPSNYQGIHV